MAEKIIPLDKNNYEDAARIAVEGNTGKEKDIRERLKDHKRYFVATENKKVIGVIGWYQDDGFFAGKALGKNFPYGKDIYWLSHFAAEPKFRNKGVGTRLLKYLEDVVKEFGGKELWVYTDQARGFYEKKGFQFVQKAWIDEYWEDVLRKRL